MPELVTASPRLVRWRARAPRIAAVVLVTILSLAGLRVIVFGPALPAPPPPPPAPPDLAAQGFAEAFVRSYLTWDARRQEAHERAVSPYVRRSLDAGAGLAMPGRGSQRVSWSAAIGDAAAGPARRIVTVAAQTGERLVYLAVPVARDPRGMLYVSSYPSIVGPPATALDSPEPFEEEVEDPALRAVVSRATTNYLARAQTNLLADLAPSAIVSLPSQALRVTNVGQITWARPGHRVALEVEAQDADRATWTLRYELSVHRGDRWTVTQIHTDPTAKEAVV